MLTSLLGNMITKPVNEEKSNNQNLFVCMMKFNLMCNWHVDIQVAHKDDFTI